MGGGSGTPEIGERSPLPTPLRVPDAGKGVHFALIGNIWNTNYPFWYPFVAGDESSQLRFCGAEMAGCIATRMPKAERAAVSRMGMRSRRRRALLASTS